MAEIDGWLATHTLPGFHEWGEMEWLVHRWLLV